MKKITEKDFVELVYNYGASGDKVFEELNLKPAQIEDVACAWAEFDEDDSEAETDKKFADYFPGFELDGKWYVNYNEKDLSGYYTGVGGMVDEDNKGIANSQDYAMKFDTKEEAESWVETHAEEWIHGDLSVW